MTAMLDRRLRVAIYNRCSTEKEVQENAIIIQEQESIRACEAHNWQIVHIYKELVSGKYADIRDEYQQLLYDITLDKFDIIVVKSQDRIMRNLGDWCQLVDLLNEYDIKLYFYMENKFYDYENDELLYGFTMQMHAFYSKNLSIKIRQSHKTRQETLSHINISQLYGWDRIDMNTFVINEKEAGYIRKGYELMRQGIGFYSISNILYEDGARSRRAGTYFKNRKTKRLQEYNDKISSTTWRKILYNPIMYGTAVENVYTLPLGKRKRVKNPPEEWIYFENAVPAIVSKEYFEESIAMREKYITSKGSRKRDYRDIISTKGRYEWSGKIVCGCCGSTYSRRQIKNKRNEMEVKWRCSKVTLHGRVTESQVINCASIVIDEPKFEKLLSDSISKQFKDINRNLDSIVNTVLDNIRTVLDENDTENELICVQAEINKQKKKKEVLFAKLMEEVISDSDFKEFNERLDTEIAKLTEQEIVLKERIWTYNNYDARLSDIRRVLQEDIIQKANIIEIIKRIETVTIFEDGLCRVVFDKLELSKFLNIYNDNFINNQLETLFDFDFTYSKKTKYQERRDRVNQNILQAFRDNPKLTINGMAELLGEKYSYIYTSIAMLRKENKLKYTQLTFEHDGIWTVLN